MFMILILIIFDIHRKNQFFKKTIIKAWLDKLFQIFNFFYNVVFSR